LFYVFRNNAIGSEALCGCIALTNMQLLLLSIFLVKVKISPACHEGIEGVVIHIHSFLTSAADGG